MSVTPDELREVAVKRVRERHDFASHIVAFVVINLGMVAVWAVTGQGYFWPGWVIGAWGIGVVLHAWDVSCASRSPRPTLIARSSASPTGRMARAEQER
jgi:hypothetical protein